ARFCSRRGVCKPSHFLPVPALAVVLKFRPLAVVGLLVGGDAEVGGGGLHDLESPLTECPVCGSAARADRVEAAWSHGPAHCLGLNANRTLGRQFALLAQLGTSRYSSLNAARSRHRFKTL